MGIVVDENFCTTKPNVYAVGDCIGGMMLAHTASFQSFVVLDQILNHENLTNFKVTPTCIFTYPEIASVGLSEEEAKLIFGEIKVKKALYRANGKANAMGSVDGFIKVIMQQDYLVGAHILGEGASTIIHEASLMMDNKLKVSECVNSIHAHPTLSEVLLEALRNLCE
jgi:dihydrolipoamide dehydrogenase